MEKENFQPFRFFYMIILKYKPNLFCSILKERFSFHDWIIEN